MSCPPPERWYYRPEWDGDGNEKPAVDHFVIDAAGNEVCVMDSAERGRLVGAVHDLRELAERVVLTAKNADGWREFRFVLEGMARLALDKANGFTD